MLLTLLLSF